MPLSLSFLVVEDDGGVRRSLARGLGSYGSVESVGTRAAARSMLHSVEFDAVVLDITLPDGSGFDLIPVARQANPAILILVLTGSSDHEVISRAHESGARYLLKPCDMKQLEVLADEVRARKTAHKRRTRLVLDRWQAEYGLSPTEVELLALAVDGVRRDDFSRRRGVRPDTIRKQIQALIQKTGDDNFESAVNSLLREAVSEPL